MFNNAFDDDPWHIAKIKFHNWSMGHHVEQEAPLEKDPKANPQTFKMEEDKIGQWLAFYTI